MSTVAGSAVLQPSTKYRLGDPHAHLAKSLRWTALHHARRQFQVLHHLTTQVPHAHRSQDGLVEGAAKSLDASGDVGDDAEMLQLAQAARVEEERARGGLADAVGVIESACPCVNRRRGVTRAKGDSAVRG